MQGVDAVSLLRFQVLLHFVQMLFEVEYGIRDMCISLSRIKHLAYGIYVSTLRPGEVRYIVDVSEPVVPGELYWVRRTYYDGNNKEISQLTIQVRVYIGL